MDEKSARALLLRFFSNELAFLETEPWETLCEAAQVFGLSPLVAYKCRSRVGGANRQWCDAALVTSWTRFSRAMGDLEHVISVLYRAGVRAVPLKGPLLAQRHYEPPFLRRPSTDLDVAIRDEDLEKACASLAGCGYELGETIRSYRATCHEAKLTHPSRMTVELHFRLSHGAFGIPTADFLDRATESYLPSGQQTWILEPADELLHLILHLASDRFHSLFHQYELRHVWNRAPLETRREAISRAVGYEFAGAVALADLGLRLRWNEPLLPPEITLPRTWLHARLTPELYEAMENWMEPDRKLTTRLRGRLMDLQVTDSFTAAARLAVVMAKVSAVRLGSGGWRSMPPARFGQGLEQPSAQGREQP